MRFRYITKSIQGKTYISGVILIAEYGMPREPYEMSQSFIEDLLSKDGKLQWTIRENPDYDPVADHIDSRYIIEHQPLALTSEEKETKRWAAVRRQFAAELPNIILQNKDNPAELAEALCARAKQIERETKG